MAHKEEFPPLLPFGFHPLSNAELKSLAHTKFRISNTRSNLWDSLTWLHGELRSLGIPCVLWIDGSYLTEKIDPDDVDLVVEIDFDTFNAMDPSQLDFIDDLVNNKFHRKPKKLHTFVMFSAPAGHPEHTRGERVRKQWQKDFGYSYVKKTPKGIVLLDVTP